MSDIDTDAPAPEPSDVDPGVVGEEPTAPADGDPIVKLRRENAAWRARARALEGIPPSDLEALDPFFAAVRAGDDEAVRQWITAQYNHFVGNNPPPVSAPTPAPVQSAAGMTAQAVAAAQATQDRPLTEADLQRILAERDRESRAEMERRETQRRIMDECRDAGLDPSSPHAKAVFAMARQMMVDEDRPVSIAEAFDVYKRSLNTFVAAPPPASTPGAPGTGTPGAPGVPPPPAGVATAEDRWAAMTPAERARERLRTA